MLGYRSLFTVPGSGVLDATREQLYSWLRHKRLEADRVEENGLPVLIGSGAEAVMTAESLQDGSRSLLFTLREDRSRGEAWISQVIAHTPARSAHGHEPWVWIDVEAEGVTESKYTQIPRLARSLLEVLQGDDGGARLGAAPEIVGVEGVHDLVAALRSGERRGPVFVAGTSADLPISRWTEYVGGLLRDTVGLAAGYVLDAEATAALHDAVGDRHAVTPGTLRTYLPGVDPNSDLDALRHRSLTTETILRTPEARIRRTLGERARAVALAAAVPRWAARVETRLLEETDARVLGWRPTALVEVTRPARPVVVADEVASHASATVDVVEVAAKTVEDEAVTAWATVEGATVSVEETAPLGLVAATTRDDALNALAAQLFGAHLDAALLRDLAREQARSVAIAAEVLTLHESMDRAERRATQLNDRVLTLQDQVQQIARERDDVQLDWAMAIESATVHERTVRALRRRLVDVGAFDAAWTPTAEPEGRELAPTTFADLVNRLTTPDSDLTHITFTGDARLTEELDVTWPLGVEKSWQALLALDDYARGKITGDVCGDVDQYLKDPPVGYIAFSANRHARDESETVKNNPKFRRPRLLRVPRTISASGTEFMGAHLKLAQLGLTSPRLHYLDATGIDGKVYVGYLGPHLPTGRTN